MTRDEVDEELETWIVVFDRHALKISRTKTEYLPNPTKGTTNCLQEHHSSISGHCSRFREVQRLMLTTG